MWHLQWCKWLFILMWLFVLITIVQIGLNIIKGRENKIKPITLTVLGSTLWTIFVLVVYKIIENKFNFIFTGINQLLNYILNLLPTWLWLYFLVPMMIAYLIFVPKGIYQYIAKAISFKKATKDTIQEVKELTEEELNNLDELSEKHNAETVMLFNKLIFKAKRDANNLYVVKNNDYYWIPIWSDTQLDVIKKKAAKLASSIKNIEYPQIVKLSKKSINLFNKKDGIAEFRKELEGGK